MNKDGIKQSDVSSVSRIIKKHKISGCVSIEHNGGRPRCISKREDALIVRSSKKDSFKSSSQIRNENNINVSSRTIGRRLVDVGLLFRRPARKPLISKKNQIKRLSFAKAHIHWTAQQWKNVLWSDDSKFNFIASDGLQRVRPKIMPDC